MPTRRSQPCIASAANSGPLSDQIYGTVAQQERIECFENIIGTHLGADHNSQGLVRELIENRQHLVTAPIAEFVVNEIDGPDVVRMRWPQSDDRAFLVVEPLDSDVPIF